MILGIEHFIGILGIERHADSTITLKLPDNPQFDVVILYRDFNAGLVLILDGQVISMITRCVNGHMNEFSDGPWQIIPIPVGTDLVAVRDEINKYINKLPL